MEKIKRNRISPIKGFLIVMAMIISSIFTIGAPIGASAEESVEETPLKVETIIDSMTFITFTKGENKNYGRHLFGCFYIPDTVYDSTYEYGVIVFPKFFSERFGITGNYLEEFEKIGQGDVPSVMKVDNPRSLSEGKLLKCGIIDIPDEGANTELSYIFYAKDPEGNIAYALPHHAAYDTLLVESYTDDEIALMIGQRVVTDNSFKQIVVKIEELVDSFWMYIIIAGGSLVVVWGAVIGIKIAVARRKEEQIHARGMLKSLLIGIIVIFVIAVAGPMLIKGLSSWLAW